MRPGRLKHIVCSSWSWREEQGQVVLCWTQWWTSHPSKCERSWGEQSKSAEMPSFHIPFDSTLSICHPPLWLCWQTRDKLQFVRIQQKFVLLWKLFKAIAGLCAGRGFNEKCGCAQWQCCRWRRATRGGSSLPEELQWRPCPAVPGVAGTVLCWQPAQSLPWQMQANKCIFALQKWRGEEKKTPSLGKP